MMKHQQPDTTVPLLGEAVRTPLSPFRLHTLRYNAKSMEQRCPSREGSRVSRVGLRLESSSQAGCGLDKEVGPVLNAVARVDFLQPCLSMRLA